MSLLVNFRKWHGPGVQFEEASAEMLEKYQDVLPDALLDEWKNYGWCSYAKGMLWLVNPDHYVDCLKAWLPDWSVGDQPPAVFARGPFGDLLVSYRGEVGQLNVHHGRYIEIGDDAEMFLEFSLDKGYLKDALAAGLAKRASKKLGAAESDEMYTFAPALALGGKYSLPFVRKEKLLPQLSMLSQLFDEVSIE